MQSNSLNEFHFNSSIDTIYSIKELGIGLSKLSALNSFTL